MRSRDALTLSVSAAVALVAGVLLLALGRGTVAAVCGIGLLGLAGIAVVSLVFLLVGESEERDRERHPHG